MAWTLEEAQQKLSELIKAASSEPQIIYQQERPVAAVIETQMFEQFLIWHQQQQKPPLADMFAKLRQSCLEENYILETPVRHNRSNPFE